MISIKKDNRRKWPEALYNKAEKRYNDKRK